MADDTVAYYDAHAAEFAARTREVDMSAIRERFLAYLPPGGAVLDAGCGSGRDVRAFAETGLRVTAFDASRELCRLAADYAGQCVLQLRFEDVEWQDRFDGVWACASLLHLPAAELPDALARLAAAVKPCGVLYASFKRGRGERSKDGRHFLDLDETALRQYVAAAPGLRLAELWVSGDLRPEQGGTEWVNVIARRELD